MCLNTNPDLRPTVEDLMNQPLVCAVITKGLYIGQLKNEQPHGQGTEFWQDEPDKKKFEGSFVSGKKEGLGKLYFKEGGHYEG